MTVRRLIVRPLIVVATWRRLSVLLWGLEVGILGLSGLNGVEACDLQEVDNHQGGLEKEPHSQETGHHSLVMVLRRNGPVSHGEEAAVDTRRSLAEEDIRLEDGRLIVAAAGTHPGRSNRLKTYWAPQLLALSTVSSFLLLSNRVG